MMYLNTQKLDLPPAQHEAENLMESDFPAWLGVP